MTAVPRVAYLPDCYDEVNGVAHTSRMLAAYAVRHDLPFFCVHGGSESRRVRLSRTVTRLELVRGRLSFGVERDLRFDLGLWRHRRSVQAELQVFSPDVIHVTGPNDMGQLGAWLAHRLGIPLVVSWHTNLHDFAARRLDQLGASLPHRLRRHLVNSAQRYSLRLLQDFYRLGRVVLAPNPDLVSMLSDATRTTVHLMERGVDTTLFSPERRRVSGRDFRIGFVGRLSPEKNVRALAAIDEILLRRGVEGYRFVIVGDGSERPWLAAHLRHAEFTGVLTGTALAEAFASFDTFVFPSETDTYGNVILEAMASGVPVIVSAAGGPRFLVRECVTGFVCHDASEMAGTAARLMRDRPLREAMRKAARQRALQASWASVFDRLYDAYRMAPLAPRRAATTFGRRDLTVVARAVRHVFRRSGRHSTPQGPLAPPAGTAVNP